MMKLMGSDEFAADSVMSTMTDDVKKRCGNWSRQYLIGEGSSGKVFKTKFDELCIGSFLCTRTH